MGKNFTLSTIMSQNDTSFLPRDVCKPALGSNFCPSASETQVFFDKTKERNLADAWDRNPFNLMIMIPTMVNKDVSFQLKISAQIDSPLKTPTRPSKGKFEVTDWAVTLVL